MVLRKRGGKAFIVGGYGVQGVGVSGGSRVGGGGGQVWSWEKNCRWCGEVEEGGAGFLEGSTGFDPCLLNTGCLGFVLLGQVKGWIGLLGLLLGLLKWVINKHRVLVGF